MKLSTIVTQLRALLPANTDAFTTNVNVLSASMSGNVITVNCDGVHRCSEGSVVVLLGMAVPIAASSLTRVGNVGTLVTATDHDMVKSRYEPAPSITITGSGVSQFNGTFEVLSVDNRRTITFRSAITGATTSTGPAVLLNGESALRSYNGAYRVASVVNASAFTVVSSASGLGAPVSAVPGSPMLARCAPRIAGAVHLEVAQSAYANKGASPGAWMFVQIARAIASRNRNTDSDGTDNLTPGNSYRQQVTWAIMAHVFLPSSATSTGDAVYDYASDLFRPICKSLLGGRFSSGLSVPAVGGVVSFVGHGTSLYDAATYVHTYEFEQTSDLTFEDTVGYDLDVAFRNIDLTITPDVGADRGAASLNTTVIGLDLDDDPL